MTTARTAATRLREKVRTDREALDALLDSTRIGHVALVGADGTPRIFPTAVIRAGDVVLTHGSTGSPWLGIAASGAPVGIAVTTVDGLVVARSAFESSIHYRSAVLFGSFRPLAGDQKAAALDHITEALLPGRVAELRRPTPRELAATTVLEMPITEWSLKVSDRWPDDPPDDVAGGAWAGVVPVRNGYAQPRPAPDLRAGIEIPDSVRRLVSG
jgi:nitroimidazol reductase NimA-like FMN-containing flavoprotein (pyridoxamine 5'-phosphate oxidase superfamily)